MLAPYVLLLSGNSEESCVTGNFWAPKLSQLLVRPLDMCVQVTLVAEGLFTRRAHMGRFVTGNFLLHIFMNFTQSNGIIVYNFLISHLDIFLFSTHVCVTLRWVDDLLKHVGVFLHHLVFFHLDQNCAQSNQFVDTVLLG